MNNINSNYLSIKNKISKVNKRVKEKFINYPNENRNTSNSQSDNISKRIIFDSNIGKRTEICNIRTKKYELESNYSKEKIAKSQTLINSNRNNNNKRTVIQKNENNNNINNFKSK